MPDTKPVLRFPNMSQLGEARVEAVLERMKKKSNQTDTFYRQPTATGSKKTIP